MITRDIKDRYINPYTDFGFKKLFGTEMNKDLLVSFINSLLHGREQIKELTYLNTEHLGTGESDRRAVFDVYCENEYGEKFLVEMQRGEQQFFKDRSLYYATFPIREQARRGDWDYELQRVYVIGILNFSFDGTRPDKYSHEVQLSDTSTGEVFYDKLTFIYLEMPKFNKPADELDGMFEKWLFVLKNLSRLLDRPAALQDRAPPFRTACSRNSSMPPKSPSSTRRNTRPTRRASKPCGTGRTSLIRRRRRRRKKGKKKDAWKGR